MRYETTPAILNAVNYIIERSQGQLQQNTFLRKNMNVYASQKLGSLINEMGQLIYEEAECSNGAQSHEINLLCELDEVKVMQKDNMIPGQVKIQTLPDSQNKYVASDSHSVHSQSIRSLTHSIYSFRTNLSKQRPRNVTISNQREQLTKKDLKQHPNQLQRVKNSSSKIINSSQLVSLVPQSASRTRKSAFQEQSAQIIQQRVLEEQLQQFREEKIILQEQMKKKAIKEKTMNQMLSKDEVVLSFYYDGQLIKMNQKNFESLKQKKFNQPVVESNLILKDNDNRFWKSKRNNRKIKTQSSIGQFTDTMIQSKPQSTKNKDKQIQKKKTSLKMIQELKKNAVEITKKKAITNDEDNKKKASNRNSTTVRFNQKNLEVLPLTSDQQNKNSNLSPEEQLQQREHHLEFLMKGLEKFHQQEKNFMPEWWRQVEKGCKVSVYLAEKKPQKQNDKKQEKQKQRFNKKSNRALESRSYSQPSQIISSMHDLQENKVLDEENQGKNTKPNAGKQLKSIQNFKNPKRSNLELLGEWKKRKSLQNIQIKVSAPTNKEVKSTTNSKAIVFSRSKSQQESHSQVQKNSENVRAINSSAKNQLNGYVQNKGSKNQNKGGQNQGNVNQDNFEDFKVLQAKNKLNLNKKQFQTLRKYLKTKNDIIWKNEKLQTDKSVQYFLNSQIHEENKKDQTRKQTKKEDKSQTNVQKQSLNTSKDEKQSANLKSLNYLNKYVNIQSKNRAFSVLEKTSLASPYKKSGSININNEKLKNTLLRQAQPDEISRSSILYILPEWQKAQIKESKEKLTEHKQINRTKQVNKSDSNIVQLNSVKNSENQSLIRTNPKPVSFIQSPSILKYSISTNARNPSSIITPSTTFNMPSKSNLLKTN